MFMLKKIILLLVASSFFIQCQHAPPLPVRIHSAKERPDHANAESFGQLYAVSTQGRFASLAAQEILDQGGNLIDAAVAASFTISVERPHSTGIGGGGFFLYHEAKTKKVYAIDFRERAPLKATRDMYVHDGKGDTHLSQDGATAAAVPGLVAGLLEIHARFGKMELAKVMAPAIRLADEGFPVYAELANALSSRTPVLKEDPSAAKIFLDAKKESLKTGDLLVQKDLAQTLRGIAAHGRAGFYAGKVASQFVKYSKYHHGLLTQKDLDQYQVKWREPLQGSFEGYTLYSMPPPSSGGVHVIQFLEFLEKDHLREKGFLSAESIHLAAASLQSAFADRAQYLGDPDFVKVPVKGLLSPAYVAARRADVSLTKARKADEVRAGNPMPYESSDTTHLSLMDREGNTVSTTQTINGWMGAGVVVPGTGVLLNNEMDDFSVQPGVPNMFGALGGDANAIAPTKTPLSSMSPTILMKDGQPRMAVGAPGGTRIISCTAQTILNYVEFGLPLYESVASIRYHHQWKPDVLAIDPPGPAPEVLIRLREMGYQVEIKPVGCNVMAVTREGDQLHGVADPRDIGTSVAK
jgi:gamma-glutamyltranspeptidase/glutathione hydrolase